MSLFERQRLPIAVFAILVAVAECGFCGQAEHFASGKFYSDDFKPPVCNLSKSKSALSLESSNIMLLSYYLNCKETLTTWMTALCTYDDDDNNEAITRLLLAQLALFCKDPRLAVSRWYIEDRPACRIMCLAFCVYAYPVNLVTGDFYGSDVTCKDNNAVYALLEFKNACSRFESKERAAREMEICYVIANIEDLRRAMKALIREAEAACVSKAGTKHEIHSANHP